MYFGAFGVQAEKFTGATSQWSLYLMVNGGLVGVRVEHSDETITMRYVHKDHLGSIAVLTNELGAVVERLSYDAWGKRRFANGADDPSASIVSETSRGFTGQEFLAGVNLVHLNGRVYDPLIGRMMAADPNVTNPSDGQAWNRYSYVGNDPLNLTDPTGNSWFSDFFGKIVDFFRSNPIFRAIFQIAVATVLVVVGLPIVAAAAISAAAATGISGGNLGDMLRAAAIAGATAFAFNMVGNITGHNPIFGTPQYFANVAGHAAVGCASSAASGGDCASGALSAGVSAAAGPMIPTSNFVGRLVAHTVIGGVASVVGGGKFENGAVTGAFGYLFNSWAEKLAKSWGFGGVVIGGVVGGGGALATAGAGTLFIPAEMWLGGAIGATLGWGVGSTIDFVYRSDSETNLPDLTDDRAKDHILPGDETGGGHRPGASVPGKSEFPKSWSDDKILGEISDVATDPGAVRTTQGTRTISEGTRDGIDIRTVDDGRRIITGYPTNVPRNPP